MKRLQLILNASVLIVAITSAAFAGSITTLKTNSDGSITTLSSGSITTLKTNIDGSITTLSAVDDSTALTDNTSNLRAEGFSMGMDYFVQLLTSLW